MGRTWNRSINDDFNLKTELGVFDTLGYKDYENSDQLLEVIKSTSDTAPPLASDPAKVNTRAPVYLLEPKFKTDQATRVVARVKRARLFFRSFDPNEQPRLSAHDARSVAQSQPMRQAEECTVREIIDVAAARALDVNPEILADWRRRLEAEPTISNTQAVS